MPCASPLPLSCLPASALLQPHHETDDFGDGFEVFVGDEIVDVDAGEQGAGRRGAAPVGPYAPARPDHQIAAQPARTAARDAGGPVALEGRLLGLLGPSPTDENVLIRTLGVAAAVVAPVILSLELDGRITRLAGGRIALAV